MVTFMSTGEHFFAPKLRPSPPLVRDNGWMGVSYGGFSVCDSTVNQTVCARARFL